MHVYVVRLSASCLMKVERVGQGDVGAPERCKQHGHGRRGPGNSWCLLRLQGLFTSVVVLTVAPAWRSFLTTFEWPLEDAMISAVSPPCTKQREHYLIWGESYEQRLLLSNLIDPNWCIKVTKLISSL